MSQPLIMSYRPDAAEMCLDGRKRETRRIASVEYRVCGEVNVCFGLKIIKSIKRSTGRILWSVGKSIAIKPGRTAKAIGRVMCIGLAVEQVQDITEEGARLEGMDERCHHGPIGGQWALGPIGNYYNAWQRLHPTAAESWEANPPVVVIKFRPLKAGER